MSNGTSQQAPLADAAVRDTALTNFDVPILVQAGAGTGKTAILAGRIIAWSLGPGWQRYAKALGQGAADDAVAGHVLSRIVAITFTEKAAAEMAERIGLWLRQLASGQPVGPLPVAVADPTDAAVRQRARALAGALDRLHVQTIHSWCASVLRQFAAVAGLDPAFVIDADGSLLDRAVRRAGPQAVRAAFAAHPAEVQVLLEADQTPDRWIEAAGALVAEDLDGRDVSQAWPAADLDARLAQFRQDVEALWVRVQGVRSSMDRTLAEQLHNLARRAGASNWQGWFRAAPSPVISEGQRAQLSKWRRRRFGSKAFEAALGANGIALAVRVAQAASDWVQQGETLARFDPRLIDAVRAVLPDVVDRVRAELERQGALTFGALIRRAVRLLAQGAVVRALRQRIDLLLVDEFQDTDALQCCIVEALALDPARPGPRPSLFVVGDPKQSIYGWRSADMAAWNDFVEKMGQAGGEVGSLVVNFRSYQEILDAVEHFLQPVMDVARCESAVLSPPFEGLTAFRGAAAAGHSSERIVEVWLSSLGTQRRRSTAKRSSPVSQYVVPIGQAREREAEAVARDIARLHDEKGVAWDKFGILMRATTSLDVYLEALRRHGIPYVVRGERSYYQRREVRDAVALLAAVLDPDDLLSTFAWLRSPAVGVPDRVWAALWQGGLAELLPRLGLGTAANFRTVDAIIAGAAEAVGNDPALGGLTGWGEALRRALRVLAGLRQSARTDPVDVFIEKMRRATAQEAIEAARYLGMHRVARLRRIYDLALDTLMNAEGGVRGALRELRRRLDDEALMEAVDAGAGGYAVEVSTIHAAKGLEYDYVYVVDTASGGLDRPAEVAVRWLDAGQVEWTGLGVGSVGWVDAQRRIRDIRDGEIVRLFYVALTRARDRLVVCASVQQAAVEEALDNEIDRVRARPSSAAEIVEWGIAAPQFDAGEWEDPQGMVWWRVLDPVEQEGDADADRADAEQPSLASLPPGEAPWIREHAERLAARRATGRARMERPVLARATSAGAPQLEPEPTAAAEVPEDVGAAQSPGEGGALDAPATGPADQGAFDARAAALGTLVHAVLEHADFDAPFDDQEADLRAVAERVAPSVGLSPGDPPVGEALRIARDFFAGPLVGRLRRGASHAGPLEVIGREVPLLVEPDGDEGPTGAVVGTIDLLARNPATGEFVIVDYKTDRVATLAEAQAHAAAYRSQLAWYTRAVRRAFDTDAVRAELWFVRTGHAVPV